MIHYPPLAPYADGYAALAPDMTPLSVTVRMVPGSRIVHYNAPTLDGLLSWCVVHEATEGRMLPRDNHEPYAVPVPLAVLWREPETDAPLHAVTPLVAAGAAAWDSESEIKRPQEGRFTRSKSGRFILTPSAGRWRARQIRRPVLVADTLVATCVGDRVEITRLLEQAVAIGKRRASGHGAIQSWEIADAADWQLVRDGRLTRPVPQAARHLIPGTPHGAPALGAWSLPAWQSALYRPVWVTGTEVGS